MTNYVFVWHTVECFHTIQKLHMEKVDIRKCTASLLYLNVLSINLKPNNPSLCPRLYFLPSGPPLLSSLQTGGMVRSVLAKSTASQPSLMGIWDQILSKSPHIQEKKQTFYKLEWVSEISIYQALHSQSVNKLRKLCGHKETKTSHAIVLQVCLLACCAS